MAKAALATYRKFTGIEEADRLALIYEKAARVIHERGFDATSLNDIAEAVGVTKGGLYHYIDGKEGLLFAIMNFAMDIVAQEIVAPAREVADAAERLRLIVRNHAQVIIEKGQAMTILLDENQGLTPAHRKAIARRRRAYYEFMRETLEALQAEGKLAEVDVSIAAMNLMGQLVWLAHWYNPQGRMAHAAFLDEFTKVALTGLLLPGSPRRRK
jgi:TetR/AcrR family transcriptional regulator, cholesterol catabolism regulator